MSSPTETTPLPDPLPPQLKALLELNRETEESAGLGARDRGREYFQFYISAVVCGAIIATSHYPFLSFVGAVSAALVLHNISERRAQRRLQLLLTVIRGLERREDAPARS